jgi:polysaccharide export outer membrane protein
MNWTSLVIKVIGAGLSAGLALLILLTLAGCQSDAPPAFERFQVNVNMPPAEPPRVTLAPGDVVDVKFYTAPELNELEQRVRPDGFITLQLVGDVPVQGRTPAEVRAHLRDLFKDRLQNPEVAVIVQELENRKVYVSGEVMTPSEIAMPGRMTALEAIMASGGFNMEKAEIGNVLVIRHKNGVRYGGSLNFKPALKGEEAPNFFLEPNDIVFVPQTSIAMITQWIDQHINQIIPVGFTLTQTRGNTTVGIDTGFSGRR